MTLIRKVAPAVMISLAAHLCAAMLLDNDEPAAETAGGSAAAVVFSGDAFADSVAAGEPSAELPASEAAEMDPASNETDEKPVEAAMAESDGPETQKAAVADIATATADTDPVRPVAEPAREMLVETPNSPARSEPVSEKPVETPDSPVQSEPVPSQTSEQVSPLSPAVERQVVSPAVSENAGNQAAIETVQPPTLPVREPVTAPVDGDSQPVPTPRATSSAAAKVNAEEPSPTAKTPDIDVVESAEPVPVPTFRPRTVAQEKVQAKAAVSRKETSRKKTSEKGRSTSKAKKAAQGKTGKEAKSRARKGGAGGKQKTNSRKAGSRSKSRRASKAGNAAVSNYPGKVAVRIRRSLRYPRKARSSRVRGEVHVGFTVSANGGAGRIRVVKSSGSSMLDKAATDAVRRASPFPPIPSQAGRRSWSFTVPLAFTR